MTKEMFNISLKISEEIYNVLFNSLNMYKELLKGNSSIIFEALEYNGVGNEQVHVYKKSFQEELKARYFGEKFKPVDKGIDIIISKINEYSWFDDINLELTNKEYETVLHSLDLYGRLLMGQTNIIEDKLMFNGIFCDDKYESFDFSEGVKRVYFSNYSMSLNNSPINAKRAIELYSNLRYKSGLDTENVWGREPMSYLESERLIVNFN